jgi:CRISP-associated protein Cas1
MFDGLPRSGLDDWADRNQHWIAEFQSAAMPRRRRERQKDPLILCGHGISLRVDGGTLVIRNGLTHYPQPREEVCFFKGDPAIPLRIILLDGSGCISFDVLDWLAQQSVTLVRIDWKGEAVSVFAASGFSADTAKVRWQVETGADPLKRIAFATKLINEKIANSIETLRSVIPEAPSRERGLAKLFRQQEGLKNRPPESVSKLLGIEGQAGLAYFRALEGIPLSWKSAVRRPIPEGWRCIGSRSAVRAAKEKNSGATQPVHAMLNYAYAVLQTQLQIQAVADGFDPTLGIMHQGRRGAPALVFDLMEPSRPKVDAVILTFALSETFSATDFVIRSDGVIRLAPQLARRVCQLVSASRVASPE